MLFHVVPPMFELAQFQDTPVVRRGGGGGDGWGVCNSRRVCNISPRYKVVSAHILEVVLTGTSNV